MHETEKIMTIPKNQRASYGLALVASVLFMILIFAPAPSKAQETPRLDIGDESARASNEQQAENFFKDCQRRPIIALSEETDLAFCACAAGNLLTWLNTEEPAPRAGSFLDTVEEKKLDANTLMTQVYAGCFYIPMYDVSYEECMETNKLVKDYELIDNRCKCEAEGISAYFEKFAKPYLEMRIADGAKIFDPVEEVKRDEGYYFTRRRAKQDCFAEYTRHLN